MPTDRDGYTLRLAQAQDSATIRALINQVRINPLGLHWQRFVLAVDTKGSIIGCGQIKQHGDGSSELASIAVSENWRKRGVASAIIHFLIGTHKERLYLTCQAGLGSFYQHFGFRLATSNELSPYFRRLNRLVRVLHFLRLWPGEGLWIMVREKQS